MAIEAHCKSNIMAAWFTVIRHLGGKSHRGLINGSDLILLESPDEWNEHSIRTIKGASSELSTSGSSAGTALKTDTPIEVVLSFGMKYIHVWLKKITLKEK
jgi:hypothetical protein